ncbi:Hypothetical protein GLP15_4738 [Giardia lamblia P15]|uniref:Uncharacterized protein n=1 Tax=Giardia intestinalis (strain P15) TaxID=658858 RepID=E1F4F6_GIAIA|nr:Hypothetical protein GLP15_4738 [Giardia lamblia P15]
MLQLPSLNLPDALFSDETLGEAFEIAPEPSAVPSAGLSDGKKGPGRGSKYMNILDFVKKVPKQSNDAQALNCTQPLKTPISAFERPLAKTDLSYPLPTHAIYTTMEDIEAFLGRLFHIRTPPESQMSCLASFYQNCEDRQKSQPTNAIMRPHITLRRTLLDNDVDVVTANKVRRVFFGFFETPETLRILASYPPGASLQLQQFLNANRQGELIIPAQNDTKMVKYYEERVRYVHQRIKELQRHYNEEKPNEEKGFTRGVASIFMPSRTFFGHHCIHAVHSRVGPCSPFEIEDGIDYDCETCGFDQSTEVDESSSEGNDENNSELQNLNLPEDSMDQLDPRGHRTLVGDDLESSDDEAAVSGATTRFADKERALRHVARHANRFTWPVPTYTPDAVAGIRASYSINPTFYNGFISNTTDSSVVTIAGEHENIYGVVLNTEQDFKVYQPIFLQYNSS